MTSCIPTTWRWIGRAYNGGIVWRLRMSDVTLDEVVELADQLTEEDRDALVEHSRLHATKIFRLLPPHLRALEVHRRRPRPPLVQLPAQHVRVDEQVV
jgi:hypothetical protein